MPDIDDYLMISGIQHFAYCPRQWALIHVESQWADNTLTVSGELMHTRAHNHKLSEKRGALLTVRDLPIVSHEMQVRGACDVVEFCLDENGVMLHGRKGRWLPVPVEYKRGKPKMGDEDRLQLCTQAICLEEMLACQEIETAYLYYGETRRREVVELSHDLRSTVKAIFAEMHGYYQRGTTPKVRKSKKCTNCSFKDTCLPSLASKSAVSRYIDSIVGEGGL